MRGTAVLGAALAFVVGDVLRIRRDHVEASMVRAGVSRPRQRARAMYRSLGEGLVELLQMAFRRGRLPVTVPQAVVRGLVRDGRGAVVATAHTGNWDLVACAVAAEASLTVVTKRLKVGFLDRLWQGARRERGLKLVEAGRAAHAVSRALGRGEMVAMMIDQAPERDRAVISLPFLGATASVDLVPALCALRAKAPVVVAFPRRLPDGSHDVHVAARFEPPEHPSRAWAIRVMTEATALLEAFVTEHPEQWLWMHRRWKSAPSWGGP